MHVFVEVVKVPRPTFCNRFDLRLWRIKASFDLCLLLCGKRKETQNEHHRYNGEERFNGHVVANLRWYTRLAFTTTVSDGGPDNEPPSDSAHYKQNDP